MQRYNAGFAMQYVNALNIVQSYPQGFNARVLKMHFVLFFNLLRCVCVCVAGDVVFTSGCFPPPGATTHTSQTCLPAGLRSRIFAGSDSVGTDAATP